MTKTLPWYFPLPRPHTGIPLGNGTSGMLVWGENQLLLTISRAGFWDRRGGRPIPLSTTFRKVRECLEAGDRERIRTLFPPRGDVPGEAPSPQQMGGGRVQIRFPGGLRPISAELELGTATICVRVAHSEADTAPHVVKIRQATEGELFWIELPEALAMQVEINLFPAFELVHNDAMGAIGIRVPEQWNGENSGGFLQRLPADEPLAVLWKRAGSRILVATALGENARAAAETSLGTDIASAETATHSWWAGYWQKVPLLRVPDATLQELYDFGLYRQAGMIRRAAPAATLQGPWMEDTRIPPWSNDYHFNINVQLVYGAALATGQADEMTPLWDMLKGWLPQLCAMGESFYELPGAMLLPHAVDDQCQLMGGMWSGAIDQACIAWMGQIAYQHYQHTLDLTHLREIAWPLLTGAFLGYFAMLETIPGETKRYSLPVSVSPEFGGAEMRECWGRDASFQLAALHSTIPNLQASAALLGEPADPRWADVSKHLPHYTVADASDGGYGWISAPRERIALWEGKDLPVSHRHHSHLAAIYPFCTIDPFDPAHRNTVARSLNHWATLGAGNWTGWGVSWASMICSRCGLPDAAQSWLHLLDEAFTTEGRATLHNANHAGMFGWDDGSMAWPDFRKGSDFIYHEVMQMDAALGSVTAVLEMLIRYRDGTIFITDRLPKRWRDASFERIRVQGAFLVSATFQHARVVEIVVESDAGEPLRLAHSIAGAWTLDDTPNQGPILEISTEKGRSYRLRKL